MKILACNANRPLAEKIAAILNTKLVDATIKTFSDKEIFVEVHENVRGEDVFVIQPTSCPANENLMELLIAIDALKRASAKRITAVLPYYGYARQDRKPGPRTPISAKLVANLITIAGADRVLTMDLHAGQIQGFFDIPLDNLYAAPIFIQDINGKFEAEDSIVVSPDVGGVARARYFASRLNLGLAIVDKRRDKPNCSEVMNIIGDVSGKNCIMIDDMVDTGGTLANAAKAILDSGAKSVSAYISHGVLSNNAVEKINNSVLTELVITDSINHHDDAAGSNKVRIITASNLIADAIDRIANERSVSSLFV
ncbi:MAG: ribose-phosphate pyrophosphokinase [Rickettsiales bacterium]|jgi:ribose-phosphate pyrophosphokinase|nr:ribose-phosphate pyrophosphokinase [Rickettsiales bacterium]